MKKFIHCMYENNLFIKDGIIYDTTYGCSKQYTFENTMWLLSVLELTKRVIIDRCINAPGNGRSKRYVINGAYKTYLKQKMCMIGTE